jgi:hypothetical protein
MPASSKTRRIRRSNSRTTFGGSPDDHDAPRRDDLDVTEKEGTMPQDKVETAALRARPGDRLVIRGHRLGEPVRDGEILEVRGADGGPPFRVRWEDTGAETILFPGTDAYVEQLAPRRREVALSGGSVHGLAGATDKTFGRSDGFAFMGISITHLSG